MIKQETNGRRPEIIIPSSKRFHQIQSSQPQKHSFLTFQNQFIDVKSQLSLRPEKSGFTLVCLSQEDATGTFRNEKDDLQNIKNCPQNKVLNFEFHQLFKHHNAPVTSQINSNRTLNTKNILRNICNAQNQYILFNPIAQNLVHDHFQSPLLFKKWVSKQKYHTFEEFQNVWNGKNVYVKVYKILCRKFYVQNAVPYIMNSRIRNKITKMAHIRFLYRFLQGLQDPDSFSYFKSKQENSNSLRNQEKH